jgi:hypothetical protein
MAKEAELKAVLLRVRVGCREFKRIGDKPQPNLTPSDFGFWRWIRTR